MTPSESDYVVALALGPVQGFIAAARRGRDLWTGSWVLSEMAKAAARAWLQAGREHGERVELVFPAVASPETLLPGSVLNVGNKLRAILRAATEPQVRAFAAAGAEAARRRWRELAEQARARLGDHAKALRQDIWDAQLDDYVEAYAAWARLDAGDDTYGRAVEAAEAALAARKATRDFAAAALQARQPGRQIPKSSLDGARETVLPESGSMAATLRAKLGLAESEQLDLAGVVKRLAGDVEQFTPISRIAAHDWLQGLQEEDRLALSQAYEPLPALGLATRVRGNEGCYAAFAFDAALCFCGQLEQALAQARREGEHCAAFDALNQLGQRLKAVWKTNGEPVPYAVMMQADGDRMGELLSAVRTLAGHQAITQHLSRFADEVPRLLRTYAGHALYAGGDDVLALLPLSTAAEAAQALADRFRTRMAQAVQDLRTRGLCGDDAELPEPTLSVGLAIVHVMEPMGLWREHALAAEKHAKGDHDPARRRNGLAVRLAIRAGHIVQLRWRWDDDDRCRNDGPCSPLQWLQHWRTALRRSSQQALPSRFAFDLRALAAQGDRLRLAARGRSEAVAAWAQAEWDLLCQRARLPNGHKLDPAIVEDLTHRLRWWSARPPAQHTGRDALPSITVEGMQALADELIVARWMAARASTDLTREEA